MNFILKHKSTFIGIVVGALCGYLYFYFVGCSSGTCAITSKPINSTLYGAMMGGLFVNSFKKKEIRDTNNKQ